MTIMFSQEQGKTEERQAEQERRLCANHRAGVEVGWGQCGSSRLRGRKRHQIPSRFKR